MKDLYEELFENNSDPWATEPDFIEVEEEEEAPPVEEVSLDEWLEENDF